jgi:hypothetical protein
MDHPEGLAEDEAAADPVPMPADRIVVALWQRGHIFAAILTTPASAYLTLVMSEHILWTGAAVCFVIALAIIAFTV